FGAIREIAIDRSAVMSPAVTMGTPERDAYSMSLDDLNPATPERFQDDTIWPYFERLRREDPVHLTERSELARYWSVTTWEHILAVDTNHAAFSSAEGITLPNLEAMARQQKMMEERLGPDASQRRTRAGFITMDEPEHAVQRKAVSPTMAP